MKVQDVWRQKDCLHVNYMLVQSIMYLSTFLEYPGSAIDGVANIARGISLVTLVLRSDLQLETYLFIVRHLDAKVV
jgi:hypothetical protein